MIRPGALRVNRRDLPWLAGMGVLAVGTFQVLWILAILTNGASVSTVIQCNAPIIVTLLAWVFWREPLTWRKWVAIGLAFVGTVLVSGLIGAGSIHLTPLGLLISLGSALAYAAITLFSQETDRRLQPVRDPDVLVRLRRAGAAPLPDRPAAPGRDERDG